MIQSEIVNKTIIFVRDTLKNAEGGHDWWHIERVWKLSKHIAEYEKADLFIVELGALLHDISDTKFNNGDEDAGPTISRNFLQSLGVDNKITEHVGNLVRNISFRGGAERQTFHSLELNIVQDADRLDALGAIGIARTFNYGGFKGREIYNPAIAPNLFLNKEEYRTSSAPSINHFYEKLLKLKDMMNTATGKKMAEHRHEFLESYLCEFYKEWDGLR
jgi:uncharacterized protein